VPFHVQVRGPATSLVTAKGGWPAVTPHFFDPRSLLELVDVAPASWVPNHSRTETDEAARLALSRKRESIRLITLFWP
jgi:hypothetical protein